MSQPGSLTWFAQHESRLAWREMLGMMTAGRADRERKVATGVAIFVAGLHGIAYLVLRHAGAFAQEHDLATLVAVMSGVILSASAMLSQAMENVTRTFYTRSDLELILSSPALVPRLFAVRIGAIALSVSGMSLLLIGPFIDVLAWQGGVKWLGAYGVIFAISLAATALAIVLTAALFQSIGPKRTRLVAQITAAVIGGIFVIGLQLAAMFSAGTMSRLAFLQSTWVMQRVPGIDSLFWLPARAALGEAPALAAVILASVVVFVITTLLYAPRFATYAIAASGISQGGAITSGDGRAFRVESAGAALRRKERLLLIRDPWLMSQSLMQVLYLLPPAFLLWHNYASGGGAAIVLVPVLVMAAGQLAGGLTWLTISGEDAPDLVHTAPVASFLILRVKIEAVMQSIAMVFWPFVIGLGLFSPGLAFVAALCIGASAAAAAAIQLWFRAQAKRSQFRRRHTSSRIATFAEAVSSVTWAATGAVAAVGSWTAIYVAMIAVAILALVYYVSPARARA